MNGVPEFALLLPDSLQRVVCEDRLELVSDVFRASIPNPSPAMHRALDQLMSDGLSEERLCEEMISGGETQGLMVLLGLLQSLSFHGLVIRQLVCQGRPFARYIPNTAESEFELPSLDSERSFRLSKFAFARAVDGVLRAESALGKASVELHSPAANSVFAELARECSLDDLAVRFPEIPVATLSGLLCFFLNADLLETPESRPSAMDASSWWEFHDLLFHMRSRLGRHSNPYGGTCHFSDRAAPPLVRTTPDTTSIALVKPDMARLRSMDRPLADVMESRRSQREFGDRQISLSELGEFLFRTARYQDVFREQELQLALRPCPAGGALQELDLYPVVVNCEGLDSGVYRYDPLNHQLVHMPSQNQKLSRLLQLAQGTAHCQSPPQVYLAITARCQRVFWKYQSVGYALILKNLGALYATMYLAAEAMNLAACALGGGDSELFSQIAQLDPCEEPQVGEFILGSRKAM